LAVRDPFAEPSRAAIRALGAVAAEDATAVLQAVISNNDNYFLPSVRATAAEVLAAFPGPVAKDWLRSVANNPHEDPAVRQAAWST
jgi:HEAT repeat protein